MHLMLSAVQLHHFIGVMHALIVRGDDMQVKSAKELVPLLFPEEILYH